MKPMVEQKSITLAKNVATFQHQQLSSSRQAAQLL
jgi:hypothetical protein